MKLAAVNVVISLIKVGVFSKKLGFENFIS